MRPYKAPSAVRILAINFAPRSGKIRLIPDTPRRDRGLAASKKAKSKIDGRIRITRVYRGKPSHSSHTKLPGCR